MREYETIFVLHPSLDDKAVEAEIQAVRDLITSTEGTIEEVEKWGRRRLAYEIQKVHEGIYTLIRFKAGPQTLKDLDRRYRLSEKLLRYLTVLSEGPPPMPARADGEGEGSAYGDSPRAGREIEESGHRRTDSPGVAAEPGGVHTQGAPASAPEEA